tara:strand:+ start:18677 stop:18856 length:180 start_codon:yes stop_codon:yes gene_type:complete
MSKQKKIEKSAKMKERIIEDKRLAIVPELLFICEPDPPSWTPSSYTDWYRSLIDKYEKD